MRKAPRASRILCMDRDLRGRRDRCTGVLTMRVLPRFTARATTAVRAVDPFLNRFGLDENWRAQLARALPGRSQVLRSLREEAALPRARVAGPWHPCSRGCAARAH